MKGIDHPKPLIIFLITIGGLTESKFADLFFLKGVNIRNTSDFECGPRYC